MIVTVKMEHLTGGGPLRACQLVDTQHSIYGRAGLHVQAVTRQIWKDCMYPRPAARVRYNDDY